VAKASSQKFIARNRAPRVQIEYDVELYGAEKKIQLPFVMGVLADLSGKPAEPLPPVMDRKFLEIDVDNFDSRMKAMKPRVAFQIPNTLTGEGNLNVELAFESMDDFSPAAVASRVDALNKLLEARKQLANLMKTERIMADPKAQQEGASVIGAAEVSDFDTLLNKEFKPKTDEAKEAVERAVRTLAEQALSQTRLISADVVKSIEAIIAQLDKKLTEQINLILHHEDFQKLEGAWRGLHYLVNNTETDEMLKIRFMNISKADLGKTLKRYKGTAWDQSPLFKKVYEAEYGQFGGEPFGCLVGDYYFDQTAPDVEMLGEMSQIAAAAHTPFIAGASPTIMQMSSWQELANPRDLTKIFTTPEYAAWRSLRESEDSRYLGLAMPRYLSRLPYGAKTNPVEDFDFEEDTGAADHSRYTWANAAYAMATNINRSFKLYGWCSRIRGVESGGAVEGLPVHTFPTDDGGVDMKCPTEIAISDRREAELAKNGFMPLVHRKNSDFAAFIGAQSLQKPSEYTDPDATANANLAARLPYLFACCRFAHYLKCIVRDKIGSFKEREDMQVWLQKWIMNYVDGDPAHSSETTKAQKPLAAAEVQVAEVEGNPGYYSA
jgi:type VI secretion system protein ImpC